jgi:hypothetical protein
MGGFIPLIEAFVAFGLTMLALATAVTAIYGALLRAGRRRARGMREMMEYYYRNEVQPLLTIERLDKTRYETSYTFSVPVTTATIVKSVTLLGYGSKARQLAGVLAATGGKAVMADDKQTITFTPDAGAQAPQTITYAVETDFSEIKNEVGSPLNTFLVDMTHLPIPITNGGSDTTQPQPESQAPGRDKSDWLKQWKSKGQGREAQIATDSYASLAYTVDKLSEEEFLTRLRTSEVGRTIGDARPDAERDICFGRLKERFLAHCAAATERFGRRARLLTVIIGFLLAFAINIDSISLLNLYLRDKELVASIIENREKILAAAEEDSPPAAAPAATGGATALPDSTGSNAPAGAPSTVEKGLSDLNQLAGAISEKLAAGLTSAQGSNVEAIRELALKADSVAKDVQAHLASVQDASAEGAKLATLISSTIADVQGGFPVGWSLYPNCTKGSLSARCLAVAQVAAGETGQGFFGDRSAIWQSLPWVAKYDTGGFIKWLCGVLLTGILVGLGAPFWVEVINNFLRARNLVNSYNPPGRQP